MTRRLGIAALPVAAAGSRAAVLAVVLTIVVFGLWPFNFFPKNNVTWTPRTGALEFHGSGRHRVFSARGMAVSAPLGNSSGQGLTIELLCEPRRVQDAGLAFLVSLFDVAALEPVSLSQWKTHLVVRIRKAVGGFREIGLHDVLTPGRPVLLTLVIGTDTTRLFVNGIQKKTVAKVGLPLMPGDAFGRLVAGNSARGGNPWQGVLRGLAFYDRALSDARVRRHAAGWLSGSCSPESARTSLLLYCPARRVYGLIVPQRLQVLQRQFLQVTPPFDSRLVQDTVVNLLGFVPLGFVLCAYVRRIRSLGGRSVLLAGALGTVLSLCIELTQGFMVLRMSTIVDVLCNSAGTFLGCAFAVVVLPRVGGIPARRP